MSDEMVLRLMEEEEEEGVDGDDVNERGKNTNRYRYSMMTAKRKIATRICNQNDVRMIFFMVSYFAT